jgi:hypothetical protein
MPEKQAEGRTAAGRFASGNRFAKGNPNARRMAALRSALLECATPERMQALGDKLYAAALGGDWTAAKLLLAYAIGKPPRGVDADRLDLDEWRLLDAAPTLAQVYCALFDAVNPGLAAEILQMFLKPAGSAGALERLLANWRAGGLAFAQRIIDEEKARVGRRPPA